MKRLADPYRDLDVIDTRAPRFNQATVGLVSVLALATGWWWLLAILAAQLAIGLVFGRQYCLPCLFYFEVVQRIFGEGPLEDARPPKFANIVGAVFLTAATVAYWLGAETVGFVLGAIVAALALLAAATGFCAGCEAFKLGSFVLGRPFVSCPIPGGSAFSRKKVEERTMRRLILIVLLLIGVGLIVAPLSMSMFSRSSDGQKMVNGFRPIMQPGNVETTAMYYDDVFTPLRKVVPLMTQQNMDRFNGYLQGIKGTESDAAKLVPALATALDMTPAQVQQFIGQEFPAMAKMLQGLPQMSKDFGGLLGVMSANVAIFQQVPAGLDHYKPLVTTMQRNTGTYASVDALPRMGLFPWFFIVPGILIILGSGLLFVGDWRSKGLAATP